MYMDSNGVFYTMAQPFAWSTGKTLGFSTADELARILFLILLSSQFTMTPSRPPYCCTFIPRRVKLLVTDQRGSRVMEMIGVRPFLFMLDARQSS